MTCFRSGCDYVQLIDLVKVRDLCEVFKFVWAFCLDRLEAGRSTAAVEMGFRRLIVSRWEGQST